MVLSYRALDVNLILIFFSCLKTTITIAIRKAKNRPDFPGLRNALKVFPVVHPTVYPLVYISSSGNVLFFRLIKQLIGNFYKGLGI